MTAADIALNEALETIAYLQRRLASSACLVADKNVEIAELKKKLLDYSAEKK